MVFFHVYISSAITLNHDKDVFYRANSDVQRYRTNPKMPMFRASWILVVTWVRIYPDRFPTVTPVTVFLLLLLLLFVFCFFN